MSAVQTFPSHAGPLAVIRDATAVARKHGRPPIYTPDLAAAVLERLASGELLSEICADPAMPGHTTVWQWRREIPDFADAYARARVTQAQVVAERAVMKARTATDAALGRLAFDADRWLAGKLDPRRYGDKVQHTGADGMGPVGVAVVHVDRPPPETREEWLARRRRELGGDA